MIMENGEDVKAPTLKIPQLTCVGWEVIQISSKISVCHLAHGGIPGSSGKAGKKFLYKYFH